MAIDDFVSIQFPPNLILFLAKWNGSKEGSQLIEPDKSLGEEGEARLIFQDPDLALQNL